MDNRKIEELEKRQAEIEHLLTDPEVISDQARYLALARELSSISEPVKNFRRWKKVSEELSALEKVMFEKHDKEFIELAKSEIEMLKTELAELDKKIDKFFFVEDKDSSRDVIVEIRAGTGGLEASLFAADLLRMYTRFADRNNWKIEILSSHISESKGFKEIVFSLRGLDVYKKMKFESGVHRVQRVPTTEASGRIHTSTATVAVLPEAKDVDINLDPKDLRIDIFRSSGPGGQSVNTADSAVRITHVPTGIVVQCQDERSQLKNKNKALRVLRTRLLEQEMIKSQSQMASQRRLQIGSGDRSEKIRTYNFSEHRVTDHRIGLTIHRLEQILEGDLDELVSALIESEAKEKSEQK